MRRRREFDSAGRPTGRRGLRKTGTADVRPHGAGFRFVAIVAATLALVGASIIGPDSFGSSAEAATLRTISGTVSLGSTGAAPGAGEVEIAYCRDDRPCVTEIGHAAVGADGSFTISGLEPARYRLFFDYSGGGAYTSVIANGTAYGANAFVYVYSVDQLGLSIALPETPELSGAVAVGTANAAQPAGDGGANVELEYRARPWDQWTAPARSTTTTTADGSFSFGAVPAGEYRAKVVPADTAFQTRYWKAAGSVGSVARIFEVAEKDVALGTILLPPKGTISGSVVLGPDRLVPADGESEVLLERSATDEDPPGQQYVVVGRAPVVGGRYSFAGLDSGGYTLTFAYLPGDRYLPWKTLTTVVDSSAGSLNPVRDAFLRVGYTIEGTVALADPAVPARSGEVRVEALAGTTVTATTLTDERGRFRLTGVGEGQYLLRFTALGAADYPVWHEPGQRSWAPGFWVRSDVAGKDVVIGAGDGIRGTVTDTKGRPLGGIEVSTSTGFSTVTRPDGSYQILAMPPTAKLGIRFADPTGRYPAQGWRGRNPLLEPAPVDLTRGAIVNGFDAKLARPATITGVVSGLGYKITGEPEPVGDQVRLQLEVYDASSKTWVLTDDVTYSDRSGRYEFTGLSPDRYRISVSYAPLRGRHSSRSPIFDLAESETRRWDSVLRLTLEEPDRDYSGDGQSDVLARTSGGALVMYRGMDKAWGAKSQVSTGWSSMTAVFGGIEFSGDGYSDLVARDRKGTLWLYAGTGRGGFRAPVQIATGWQGFTALFSPGDLDTDGHHDIVARDAAGKLWLYKGNGKSGFKGKVQIGSGWSGYTVLSAGDFDNRGGGNADLIARDGAGKLWLYPGTGTGKFQKRVQLATGWGSYTAIVSAGDRTGDEIPDLLTRDAKGQLWLHANTGSGGLKKAVLLGTGWNSLSIVG